MPDGVDWHPERFRRDLDEDLAARADLAGAVVRTRARLLAGRPGTPRLRSRPGEPPRRQTGRLVASIAHVVIVAADAVFAVVGSGGVPYAIHLARGTPRMAPRPYLTRALRELRGAIRDILTRGW